MSKKNFVTLILALIGGILFALGMCMAMLPAWNAFTPGVILGAAGLAVLLAMVIVRRKMEGKSIVVRLTARTIGTVILVAAGVLAFGGGMCMVMVWDMLVYGIAVGLAGIVLLLCLIPAVKGLK